MSVEHRFSTWVCYANQHFTYLSANRGGPRFLGPKCLCSTPEGIHSLCESLFWSLASIFLFDSKLSHHTRWAVWSDGIPRKDRENHSFNTVSFLSVPLAFIFFLYFPSEPPCLYDLFLLKAPRGPESSPLCVQRRRETLTQGPPPRGKRFRLCSGSKRPVGKNV